MRHVIRYFWVIRCSVRTIELLPKSPLGKWRKFYWMKAMGVGLRVE